jgi:arylsulfatase A-like enzyme
MKTRLSLLACLAFVGLVRAAERPNLVVIFTDDQVHNAIGYDNPEVHTPQLDALAAQGMIFEKAYVATPICAASRASKMTGLFPQQHGVIALDKRAFQNRYWDGKPHASRSLPRLLGQAGYHSAAYGKSHLGPPKNYGFDEGKEMGPHDDRDTFARVASFVAERAASDKPFFLWLAPHQPHVPLLPQQRWLDLYDPETLTLPANFRASPLKSSINNQGVPGAHYYRDSRYVRNVGKLPAGPPRERDVMRRFVQAYYAVVSHLDHQIGQFVTQLKDAGLWENTVLIFLSDNGYHLGSHGLGNKITMHEESVSVPMFALGPGIAPGRSPSLVSSLDLYPTLLALAGAEIPEWSMGQSLLPIFQNPQASVRQTVFSECVGVNGKPGDGHRMAYDGRHKLVLTGTNQFHLFDHKTDPSELRNLIEGAEHAPVREKLETELAAWMRQIGDRQINR